MTLLESELLNDLIKLTVDVRSKINYMNTVRGGWGNWETGQSKTEVLEEVVEKIEKIIASYPIPAHVTPTRQIKAIIRCTGKPNVMEMSKV